MTMQIERTASLARIAVAVMTIFGVLGFTASVVNAGYGGTVNFRFVLGCTGCMVLGLILAGVWRRK